MIKWPGREAGRSLSYSGELKNPWSFAVTPPYAFIALCKIKQFTSLLFYLFQLSAGAPVISIFVHNLCALEIIWTQINYIVCTTFVPRT